SCWMCTPAGWWAGRSPITCAPSSSSMPWTWPAGGAGLQLGAQCCIPITAEPEQYTSWAFGQRLRAAGLLGSMGSVGDCYDNSLAESFFGTLQLELLDQRSWATR